MNQNEEISTFGQRQMDEYRKALEKKQEDLDHLMEELQVGQSECEFLSNFLSQFPPAASIEVLDKLLHERNSSLQEFISHLNISMDDLGGLHASDLLNTKRNALGVQLALVKEQVDGNRNRLNVASELSQRLYCDENGQQLVEIKEEYVEPVVKDQNMKSPSSVMMRYDHLVDNLHKSHSHLDPEIAAILYAAEIEESGAPTVDKGKKPFKKVSFASTVEERVIEDFDDIMEQAGEDSDTVIATESPSPMSGDSEDEYDWTTDTDETEDDYDDSWNCDSVLGIPKHIMEKYIRQNNNLPSQPSSSEPVKSPPLNPHALPTSSSSSNASKCVLGEITEKLQDIQEEEEGDIDSDDMEYDIHQKELNLAYLKHKRRYEARLQRELHEQDVDPDLFYEQHEQTQNKIIESELANTLRNVVTIGGDDGDGNVKDLDVGVGNTSNEPKENDEPPKRISRFKASLMTKSSPIFQ